MSPVRRRRLTLTLTALVVVAGVVAAIVTLSRPVSVTGSLPSTSVPTVPASATDASSPQPSKTHRPPLPSAVLPAAAPGKVPSADILSARISAVRVKDMKGHYSGAVLDVGSGKLLFDHSARTSYIPASTMKVLTSAAALSILGPEHRFTTSVVSPKSGQIVLIGGGDPYLAKKATRDDYVRRASIGDLAEGTAVALRKKKITKVTLGYDASLFGGPAWNPVWPDTYVDQVTPVSALWVDEGRISDSVGPRARNPAKQAATEFAKALKKQGVSVTAIASTRAPKTATKLAAVRSLPLERIVEHLLMASDNDAAEVILRQAAIGAGRQGTTADGVQVVQAELTKLGAWEAGATIKDGSGLARQTKVPAETLAKTLQMAAGDKQPDLRPLITGLPVAGVEGSLRVRFFDDASLAGRGVVRAKTGTLREVHTLAGVVRTADGSLLSFAFLINNPKNQYAAQVWLDRVTTAISRCGCTSE